MANDIEEIVRQAEERVREVEGQLGKLRKQVEETRITARSADNLITAVVDGKGELLSLTFSTAKWRKMAPAELGAAVVKTINKAREDSRAELMRCYRATMPAPLLLPDGGAGRPSLEKMLDDLMGGRAGHE